MNTINQELQNSPKNPETILGEKETGELLNELFDTCLDERETQIITLRLGLRGERKTLKEVGRLLGISTTRVRQLEHRAYAKIRRNVRKTDLLGYDDSEYRWAQLLRQKPCGYCKETRHLSLRERDAIYNGGEYVGYTVCALYKECHSGGPR